MDPNRMTVSKYLQYSSKKKDRIAYVHVLSKGDDWHNEILTLTLDA
jgi:hypothetical protein